MRRLLVLISLWALPAFAVVVPADLGIGPSAFWFFGPLTDNRGAVPHFALAFDLAAVIDRDWILDHPQHVPAQYRGMADKVTEVRIGPSFFIPSTLYVSPPIDPLGGAAMFGASWTPFGLTFLNVGQKSNRLWKTQPVRFLIDAQLLITALGIFNTAGDPRVPLTFFLRPGLQLKLTTLINLSEDLLLSISGGGQIYVPQRLGAFIEFGPLNEAIFVTAFASLQFHFRFPYDAQL